MELFELEKELHVIDGENLKKHPWEEIAAVHRFLGLPVSITKKVSASNATITMMLVCKGCRACNVPNKKEKWSHIA